MERQIRSQVQEAADAAVSRNATDPVALDVSGRLALTDAFLIVSGSSERNVSAIADAVDERLGASGVQLKRREGRGSGHWELLDFGDLVVHVFNEEDRSYYGLERLWRDCPVIPIEQQAAAS
ncbi:ribosome silencing factor [Amnibacterium kyonggiense]|uniref:Ribosomal silencing factor RsfS n=1 Tax=Amnibacterium kyonggiense TaxID=595671 RepID=A0A4R7FMF5_9MICO|nr:ribosome silencing factor [Amnibacterium kyonggiense]TDS77652.1 ribosome-associated protein [Amnibacterium kyonggiense]